MNYAKMLAYHKEMNADATIAVIEVPMKKQNAFGTMNTDGEGHIVEFEEKNRSIQRAILLPWVFIFLTGSFCAKCSLQI